MNKNELKLNIVRLLDGTDSESDLIFDTFTDQLAGILKTNEAIKIAGLGIFQLKEEPFTGAKKALPGVFGSSTKSTLLFSPFAKEPGSLYLSLDVKKAKSDPAEFNENVFSLGVNKPIIPVTEDANSNIESDASYMLLKKSVEEKLETLFEESQRIENFDLIEDFINAPDAVSVEFIEEKNAPEISESDDQAIADSFDTGNIEEDILPVQEVASTFADSDDILESWDDDSSGLEEELELTDEISEPVDIAEEKVKDISDNADTGSIEFEENSDDDWTWDEELTQDIVDEKIENPGDIELPDDTEVTAPASVSLPNEIQAPAGEAPDTIDDDTDDLFDQLEDSLKDEFEDLGGFEDLGDFEDLDDFEEMELDEGNDELTLDEIEESLLAGIDEDSAETDDEAEESVETEEDTEESPGSEEEELEIDSAETVEEKTETGPAVFENEKKEEKSFMAKIKYSLGKSFWVLVSVFIITTAAGIYYFFLSAPEPVLDDDQIMKELMAGEKEKTEHQPVAVADTVKDSTNASDPGVLKTGFTENETEKIPETKIEQTPEVKSGSEQVKTVEPKKDVKTEPKVVPPAKASANSKIEYRNIKQETQITGTQIYKSGSKYSVQLSSWKNKATAEREAQRLIKKGHNIFIVQVYLAKLSGTWYRIRVGDFDSEKEAREYVRTNKL